jgi:hypothetical protein
MAEVTFTGGQRMERALQDIATRLGRKATLRVGFLENAKYPDGTSVAMVATIQDFGAPRAGIPPRPFFRNMVAAKAPEWPAAIEATLVHNNYDAQRILNQVGEAIKGQLQQSIIDLKEPPLAPATIKRKGFDKPLIDTSHMLNSVDYEIR